jgi:hypothetical protein
MQCHESDIFVLYMLEIFPVPLYDADKRGNASTEAGRIFL